MERSKVVVTEAAMIGRLRRKLRSAEGEMLRKSRGMRMWSEFGDWYTTDDHSGNIARARIDPEDLARHLGVLAPHEMVAGSVGSR